VVPCDTPMCHRVQPSQLAGAEASWNPGGTAPGLAAGV